MKVYNSDGRFSLQWGAAQFFVLMQLFILCGLDEPDNHFLLYPRITLFPSGYHQYENKSSVLGMNILGGQAIYEAAYRKTLALSLNIRDYQVEGEIGCDGFLDTQVRSYTNCATNFSQLGMEK